MENWLSSFFRKYWATNGEFGNWFSNLTLRLNSLVVHTQSIPDKGKFSFSLSLSPLTRQHFYELLWSRFSSLPPGWQPVNVLRGFSTKLSHSEFMSLIFLKSSFFSHYPVGSDYLISTTVIVGVTSEKSAALKLCMKLWTWNQTAWF